MQLLVRRLTCEQRFDFVHADQMTMGQYALAAHGTRCVLDAHNSVWTIVTRAQQSAPLWLRPLLAREARLLKAYEGELCRQMDDVLTVSRNDRHALVMAGADATRVHVVPIAIDCAQFQPIARNVASRNILSVSTLFYPPNADGVRWFLRDVFPLVRQQVTDATLTIAGPRPPVDFTRAAAHWPDVLTVTDYVPDLMPHWRRAALSVVPVRAASGMRTRILEALALGVPVVTTTAGVEGIEAIHGEHLLIADEPTEFAAAVARVLNDHALAQRLAENGRRLVVDKYDWQRVLPKLEAVYHAARITARQMAQ